jgi:MFS family permease
VLPTVPYAVISTFLTLAYASRGWPHTGLAMLGFAATYILVRLLGSGLPDRIGAHRVAIGSLIFETLGQVLLWWAPTPHAALLGAALSGLGYTMNGKSSLR